MTAAPILPTSTLAGRAGHAFPLHTMIQGFACHVRGVEIISQEPRRLRARVRSKRMHDVTVSVVGGELAAHCSCAARGLGLAVCKHLWATLLQADKLLAFEELRNSRQPIEVVLAPEPKTAESPPPQKEAAPSKKEPPTPKKTTKKKASAKRKRAT